MICTRCSIDDANVVPFVTDASIVLYNLCADCAEILGVDYEKAKTEWDLSNKVEVIVLSTIKVIVDPVIENEPVIEVTGTVE